MHNTYIFNFILFWKKKIKKYLLLRLYLTQFDATKYWFWIFLILVRLLFFPRKKTKTSLFYYWFFSSDVIYIHHI